MKFYINASRADAPFDLEIDARDLREAMNILTGIEWAMGDLIDPARRLQIEGVSTRKSRGHEYRSIM